MAKKLRMTLLAALLSCSQALSAQDTIRFAQRDTSTLDMLMYMPSTDTLMRPCIVYIFGGGFAMTTRTTPSTVEYCRRLADRGFVVAAVDYRLGMKDYVKKGGVLSMVGVTEKSVAMAVEDVFSAVEYLVGHSDSLKIDPERIILVGSSAGAMTALQCDYELCNRTPAAAAMSDDFRFAGVVSFSGAIFTRKAPLKWTAHEPAPTLLFHGTEDRLVTYRKLQLFNLGLLGSDEIDRCMDKFGYPHIIYRYVGHYHDVAGRMLPDLDKTLWFIDHCVLSPERITMDAVVDDGYVSSEHNASFDINRMYGSKKEVDPF